MSNRWLLSAAVVLALGCALAPHMASAQVYGGMPTYQGHSDNPNGPTDSPYLNLLQKNQVGSVTNYQSLVKPLVSQGNAIARQGNSISKLQNQVYSGGAGGGTGHQTLFMNYSHFYTIQSRGR